MEYLLDRIKELVVPFLENMQVDIVELKLQRQNRQIFLRFLVDKAEGGITLKECANLNTEIGKILDDADLLQESFMLEVSSPGLDRPLSTAKDFRRVINRNIKVYLSEAVEGKIELQGKLIKAENNSIAISANDAQIVIAIDKINKAKQIIEL